MTFTEERWLSLADPATQQPAADDHHDRPALFAAGGTLSIADDPPGNDDPDDAGTELSAAEVGAGELFSTHPHDEDDLDPWIDLTDGSQQPGVRDSELLETMATAAEAMEYVERARGHLYTLHHLMVRAEILFTEVAESLETQGRVVEAALLKDEVIGRNMIDDRWSFEVVEEFDDGYHGPVASTVKELRERTVGGRRHAREAEIKRRRRRIADPLLEVDPVEPPTS